MQTSIDRPSAPFEVPTWFEVVLDEAIVRCDHAGRVVETFGPPRLLPASAEVLRGRSVGEIATLPPTMRLAWSTALDRTLDTQRAQICAYRLAEPAIADAPARDFEARMMPLAPLGEEAEGSIVIAIRDVGERNQLRERLEQVAMQDEATGLGNARALRERLETWLGPGAARTTAPPLALLLVDLDRFKQSHDLHGRSIGDSLLRLAALRIGREALRHLQGRSYDAHDAANPNALEERVGLDDPSVESRLAIARLGGDQFAVAWRLDADDRSGASQAESLASRLIAALGAPTRIAGKTLFVRASIGIALFPGDASDAAGLLSQAEAALKRAKLGGRNQFRRYGDDTDPTRSATPTRPPTSEAALRAALAADQFMSSINRSSSSRRRGSSPVR